MKFKTKLYIGFGTKLGLIIILMVFVMAVLSDTNQNMDQVVKYRYNFVQLTNTIQTEISNRDRNLMNLVLSKNQATESQKMEAINQSSVKVEDSLEALSRIVIINEVKQNLSQLKILNRSYDDMTREVVQLVKEGRKDEAAQFMLHDVMNIRKQLFSTTDQLNKFQMGMMDTAFSKYQDRYNLSIELIYTVITVSLILGIVITAWVIKSLTKSLREVAKVIQSVEDSNATELPRLPIRAEDEIGEISIAFNDMAQSLEEHANQEKTFKAIVENQSWLETKIAEVTTMYQGVQNLQELARMLITKISPLVSACYGIFYLNETNGDRFQKAATFACFEEDFGLDSFQFGEGLIGQSANEKKVISLQEVPENYIKAGSGLGMASPKSILIIPILFEENTLAIMEFGTFDEFTSLQQSLLKELSANLGITIHSIQNYMRIENLLRESQTLTEELQSQSEELQLQQEELKNINEKLEEQFRNSEQKTKDLQQAKGELEEKAKQITLSSKYKSEFLANMSHELRTPLNSLLILAEILAKNSEGNLTPKQTEFAKTIYSSGTDLLQLINDILDLSKVESGKMDVHLEWMDVEELSVFAKKNFTLIAEKKGIAFHIDLQKSLPKAIFTDSHRLQQILKNLLSNAFKFTKEGHVTLQVKAEADEILISVIDSGIGIARDKLNLIFEAFQQADGTTSRNYGGTGLGLSICQQMANLLEGSITVISESGEGSTFTLHLPAHLAEQAEPCSIIQEEAAVSLWEEKKELKESTLRGKKILIADDDMRNIFALTTVLEREQLKVIFAQNGVEALEQLHNHQDIDLILMDIMMPKMDGFEAIRAIRQDPYYQSLPIIAVTAKAMKNDRENCLAAGATDYLSKPIDMEQLFSLLHVWLYEG
jgi:two-component system, chemotaxis family, sensor kinase CheA